ncbi:hypothetical protein RJ55_03075 [Drechmeria coniospora]|nr:hypothetical protein RJ55_03075 [Drechmeria coniospora]
MLITHNVQTISKIGQTTLDDAFAAVDTLSKDEEEHMKPVRELMKNIINGQELESFASLVKKAELTSRETAYMAYRRYDKLGEEIDGLRNQRPVQKQGAGLYGSALHAAPSK